MHSFLCEYSFGYSAVAGLLTNAAQLSACVFSGDLPGFGDTAVFNMIRDDAVGCMDGKLALAKWPCLEAMYAAVNALPPVSKWIADWEAREV
jgi:hypothetical protein